MVKTFFDAFSGIGGFRLGMTRAGFQCVGWCEIDPDARKFYKKYFHPHKERVYHDITTMDLGQVPPFNCLTFGAPCQPFSYAGKRDGMADPRGRAVWDAVFQLLRVKKPQVFFLEEVAGLLSSHGGRDFAWVLTQVSEVGYDCEWNLLDWRPFNLPQSRKRLFVVGHLRGQSRSQVFPLGQEEAELYQPPETEGSRRKGRGGTRAPSYALLTHDENFAPTLSTEPCTPTITAGYKRYGKASPALIINDGVPTPRLSFAPATPTITTEYKKKGTASPTIIAGYAKRGGSLPYIHYAGVANAIRMADSIRMFTSREVFRLQGFPEDAIDLVLKMSFAETDLYRFAGNAVAPQPVTTIARKLFTREEIIS